MNLLCNALLKASSVLFKHWSQSELYRYFAIAITLERDYGVLQGPKKPGYYQTTKDTLAFAFTAYDAAPLLLSFIG